MLDHISRNADAFNQKFMAPCRVLGEGIYQSTNGNILIVGSAGTGKGYRFFTPNILREQNSMVVHDPFGNYYEDCKETLEANGFAVESFTANPEDIERHPDWSRLRKEKLALFVKSSSMAECEREMEVLFSGMVKELLSEKETPQTPVTVYLDELVNCGPIRDFDRFMALSKIHNISCIISVQSIRQLGARFGGEQNAIISQCGTVVFYGSPDEEDCHYISQRTGFTGESGECEPIAGPKEIAIMDQDNCLILTNGEPPILAKKYNFGRTIWEQEERIRDLEKENQELKVKLEGKKKRAFWKKD